MYNLETLLTLSLLLLVGNLWFMVRFVKFIGTVEGRLREIAAKRG